MQIKEVVDINHPYPTIEELRRRQKAGGEGRGLPENSVDQLNQNQAHNVEITKDEE